MAYTAPPNFVAGTPLAEADLDTLSDDITFLANPPRVRVYNSANISVATSGVGQALTFNSERTDTDTMHSTATNTSRITFTTTGVYLVGGSVRFASNATGYRELSIRKDGTNTIAVVRVPAVSGATTSLAVTSMWPMTAGEYVELVVEQTSGGALNVESASAYSPEFWAIFQSL